MAFLPPSPDVVSAANSSTTPLAGNATFTGTAVDCTASTISSVTVNSFSDQNSASGGLQLQWSQDGTNWDHIQRASVIASESGIISDKVRGKFFRVVYVNGTSAQGTFRLQTLTSGTNTSGTIRDLDTAIAGDDESQLVRAILTGRSMSVSSTFNDVTTDSYGSIPVLFSPPASDAFGRARVASPETLFNVSFEYDAQPLLMQTVNVGAGTAVKTSNVSSVTISTGSGTNGDGSIFQSKQYSRYEPGKSQFISMSGNIGAAKANVRSQIGYYDGLNGVFFDQNNGLGVTIRTHTSGATVDSFTAQASWNIDKMDGTGPSGITLDPSKNQIFVIDLQWLGTGRVRFGFIISGQLFYVHQVFNANALTVPYMNTANLPVRWEIHNTGAASGSTSMQAVCAAVLSEGGSDSPATLQFTASNGITPIGVTTRRPILSIQVKTTFNSIVNRSRIVLQLTSLVAANNSSFWELVYNPTLTGASFASVDNNSGVNFDTSATALSGGTVFDSGFVTSNGAQRNDASTKQVQRVPFTLDAAGTTGDIISLVCTSFTGTSNVNGELSWTEDR